MDPVSLAGLGLGTVSLAFQLLAGCIKGYEIMLDVVDFPENLEHIRIRMRLEQVRLLNWGEQIGLLEDLLEEPSTTLRLHRNLIIDILLEVQSLFKDCLKIENTFDSLIHSPKAPVSSDAKQILGQRSQQGANALLAKTLNFFEKTTQIPRRLQWAMVKQDKLEKLVEKLVSYNDSMVSLLDRASVDQLHEMQVQTQLVMLQLSSKIDDLKQLSLAMQIKMYTNSPPSNSRQISWKTSSASHCHVENGISLSKLADFKASQTSLEANTSQTVSTSIDRNLVIMISEDDTRCEATYLDQKVWIEWKEWDTAKQMPQWESMIEDRVKKLASLLGLKDKPEEFRAPMCLGFFADRDEDRYGLVYSWPNTSSVEAIPQSLLDLIRTSPKPSLTQRARLAHLVAQSLMYLHSVNWLHKGFRSSNIVFFTQPGQEPQYGAPIVSGFEYARPDESEESTQKPVENFYHDVYRHPDALMDKNSRSKKSWDVYSLGVMLYEIAVWQSVNEITDVHEGQKGARTKLREIRRMLLGEKMLAELAGVAGERYRDVVCRCLKGGREIGIGRDADESDPTASADMLQVVRREIVGELASIQL